MTKCAECPFRGGKKVLSKGNPDSCKYVLVGEAPGRNEVFKGEPFVGETGTLLAAFLRQKGLDLHSEDFYLMNAMSCLVKNKKKTPQAVECCRDRVIAELHSINQDATIVAMGRFARDSVFGPQREGIMAWRGWHTWEGRYVYVTVHPSFYLYNPDEAPMLIKDIKRFVRGKQPQIGPFELREPKDFPAAVGKYVGYVLDTHDKLRWFIRRMHEVPIEERGYVAVDLETDQVDFQRDRILCMSVAFREGEGFIIPDSLLYEDGHTFVTRGWDRDKWHRFLEDKRYRQGTYLKPDIHTRVLLESLFAVPHYRWVGHNSKFDMRFLKGQLGVYNAHCDDDTIHMHYVLDERKGGHGLKPLADDYFDVGDYEHDLFNYITKKSGHYSGIPREVLYRYNLMDTECTLRLAKALEAELKQEGLYEWPYLNVLMYADEMLLDAEITGMYVDWEENLRIEHEELMPEIRKLVRELREMTNNQSFNPNSSQQVNKFVYDVLKFPVVSARTRAGGHHVTGRSTQKAILDAWEKMHELGELPVPESSWEFIVKLKEFRHLRKLLGSYVRKWRKYRGTDDRVHTSFLLRGTVTGRLSATDPPMQTIPSKVTDRWGPMVANMHKAQPGWVLMYADYSQAELMTGAGLSSDEFMIKTFQTEGADYHSEVARAAFGENFTRDQRQACKKLTFGWLYGGNAREIALDALQFDGPVAERFAHEWDQMFPGMVKWRAEQGKKMLRQGYVESIYGRRRRQVLITDRNVGKAQRIAINSPLQSAVSDFVLLSATELYHRFKRTDYARVVLLIHDSLILEVREDKIDKVKRIMQKVMLDVPSRKFPHIPFQAEVKVSTQLGDLT
ncbi:MAG: DNA polymerase [Acholeplasmataceae bacterium]